MSQKQLRKAQRAMIHGRWLIADGKCRWYCRGARGRHMRDGKRLCHRAQRRLDKQIILESCSE